MITDADINAFLEDELQKEQEEAFQRALPDLKRALHSVKSALHYLYETGDYESGLLDEHVDMLQDIESEMETLINA